MGLWLLTPRSRLVSLRRPKGRTIRAGQTLTLATRLNVWTFLYLGRAGTTYWSRTDGRNVRLWYSLANDYSEVLRMKRRQAPSNTSGQKHLAPLESNVMGGHHPLVQHMAVTQYDDGEPRKPGWITVKTFGSSWQIECKDPDACVSLRVVASTLDEALTLASLLLESEEAPWEPDMWLQQQASKNRKK